MQKSHRDIRILQQYQHGHCASRSCGVIVDCNRAAEEILAFLAGSWSAKPRPILKTALSALTASLSFSGFPGPQTRSSRRGRSRVVVGFRCRDKIRKWLSIRVWPSIVGGQVRLVMSAFDDVTREVKERRFLSLLTRSKARLARKSVRTTPCSGSVTLVIEEGHYALAWIGVASSEGGVDIVCSSGGDATTSTTASCRGGERSERAGTNGNGPAYGDDASRRQLRTPAPIWSLERTSGASSAFRRVIALPIRLGSRPQRPSYDLRRSQRSLRRTVGPRA